MRDEENVTKQAREEKIGKISQKEESKEKERLRKEEKERNWAFGLQPFGGLLFGPVMLCANWCLYTYYWMH